METSYNKVPLTYDNVFAVISWVCKPREILEFGILNGFSLMALAKNNPGAHIRGCDIFDKFNGNHADRSKIENMFAEYPNVTIFESDFYRAFSYEKEKSLDLLHVDIANNGYVYKFVEKYYFSKMNAGGVIILEGGTEERDQVEWMKKYDKPPIAPVITEWKKKGYEVHVISSFPGMTIVVF